MLIGKFGKWDEILKVKPMDTLAYGSLLLHFLRGLAFCYKGNVATAKKELEKLNAAMNNRVLKAPVDNRQARFLIVKKAPKPYGPGLTHRLIN